MLRTKFGTVTYRRSGKRLGYGQIYSYNQAGPNLIERAKHPMSFSADAASGQGLNPHIVRKSASPRIETAGNERRPGFLAFQFDNIIKLQQSTLA
jgi:hypothetical protein